MIFQLSTFQLGGETMDFNNGILGFCFTVDPNGVAGLNEITAADSFYKVERTNYSNNLPLYLQRKNVIITGVLTARTPEIFKQKKREFEALFNQNLTLAIQDKTGTTTFETYTMDVRINSISIDRSSIAAGKFQIQMASKDPFIYSSSVFEQTFQIGSRGLILPITFPLVFGNNTGATITNNGTAPVYPTFTLFGSGNTFQIANQTTGKVFKYANIIPEGQFVTITPQDYDPIKARSQSGNSVNAFCDNFEALELVPGANKLVFGVNDAISGNTAVKINFKNPFYAI